jgi:hypothetical protein
MTKALVILCALGIASLPLAPIAAQAASTTTPESAPKSVAAPAEDPRADRTFHPDYSHALTPGQMTVAWQAEIDRLFPPVMAGGG